MTYNQTGTGSFSCQSHAHVSGEFGDDRLCRQDTGSVWCSILLSTGADSEVHQAGFMLCISGEGVGNLSLSSSWS